MELVHPDFLRITVNPEIAFGKPCIKGTRFPVSSVLDYLAGGMSFDDLLKEFSFLTKEDIQDALAFSASIMTDKFIALPKVS